MSEKTDLSFTWDPKVVGTWGIQVVSDRVFTCSDEDKISSVSSLKND